MNIAIIGATGKVGHKFIEVLQEKNIRAENFYLFASSKSEGKRISIFEKEYRVIELNKKNLMDKKIDYALFSAGGEIAKEYIPLLVSMGSICIDNSSAWRRNKEVPLVVSEVNKEKIFENKGIISNPNCSTIQAMLPLKALDDKYGVKRIIFSTYQAVSGAGQKGTEDLINGVNGDYPKKFIYPIFSNIIPQIDDFLENGYTKEEDKLIFETQKILNKKIAITATTARVPVFDCHCESINVELEKDFKDEDEVKNVLSNFSGIKVVDDIKKNEYPMPINSVNSDSVFVGRIRRDYSNKNSLNLWVVADNIRKGAATNAIQILEKLIKRGVNEKSF